MADRINLDVPRFDQSTFLGRLKHFAGITDFRLCIKSDTELNKANELLQKYRHGQEAPGTSLEEIWEAKRIYESAFHPDTGEKQNVVGRMSFQVPGGMLLTGAMLTFYRSVPAVIFWQWANQSFNALVNYTNRNANSPLTVEKMGVAYVSATTAALVTAIGLKKILEKRASTLLVRYVPFAAVAAANCVNIPLMRQNELLQGISVSDENGNKILDSKMAAVKGISEVVFSRIAMAAPGMTILPIIMERLEKQAWLRKYPKLNAPFQTLACGLFLVVMCPTACAIFNQKCCISSDTLATYDTKAYKDLKAKCGDNIPKTLYFNKGL